ncbi:hypothetical protein ABTQ33_10135 [Paucilactobacillus suebicus]|uniref:Uncharacterized protein n=1 Tax=Paucilactobacillus suebicus DSM 5007 = KCTC 3549 TaxID=1423807 RepID=A0A0R1VUA5_9LACO|nr:hypothetical protein [Paucilactobacillus suebicus]KRM09342.1 hypothetical protein FD16_GL001839 [Paucilactobacillus suebicus DSM 5007 = KCTC 3549]
MSKTVSLFFFVFYLVLFGVVLSKHNMIAMLMMATGMLLEACINLVYAFSNKR